MVQQAILPSRGSSWDETHITMLFFLSSDSTPQKIKLSKVLKIIFRLDPRPLQQEKVEHIVENWDMSLNYEFIYWFCKYDNPIIMYEKLAT